MVDGWRSEKRLLGTMAPLGSPGGTPLHGDTNGRGHLGGSGAHFDVAHCHAEGVEPFEAQRAASVARQHLLSLLTKAPPLPYRVWIRPPLMQKGPPILRRVPQCIG